MVGTIIHDGFRYDYEFKLASEKEICLATNEPKEYCNGLYRYSSKDPGNGKAYVVISTDNPEYWLLK